MAQSVLLQVFSSGDRRTGVCKIFLPFMVLTLIITPTQSSLQMVQAFFRRRQQRRDSKPSCHFHLQYCRGLVILRSGIQSSMSCTGQSNSNVPFLYHEFPVRACSADFDNSTTFFCLRRACLHHTQAHQGLRNPVTNVRIRGASPSIDHVFVSCCLIKHTYFVFFLHNPTWRVCVLYQLWYIRLTDSSIITKKNV